MGNVETSLRAECETMWCGINEKYDSVYDQH